MNRIFFAMAFCLSACANDLPPTSHTISPAAQNAPYPKLIPVEGLLRQANDGSQIVAATASLQARAAQLRRKANALRGQSIVDGQERLRLLKRR
jgi:hypothetical protein